jgi:hypothetical protein
MMENNFLFNHGGVRISSTHFITNSQTMSLNSIKVIRLDVVGSKRIAALLCVLIGVALLLTDGALFVFGGFSVAAGVTGWFTTHISYSLILETTEGEKCVLVNNDRPYLEKIMCILQQALKSNPQQGESTISLMPTLAPD